MEPCPECGNKPFGGKIKHKKGCKAGEEKGFHPPGGEPLTHKNVLTGKPGDELETINGHICCDEPMRRTDGAPWEVMCQHSRLLTGECAECRKQHGGILTYNCKLCGRNLQDSPQLAQGPEANAAMWTIRR